VRFARKRFDDANASECLLHRHDHLAHAFKLTSERLSRATSIDAKRQ
jgi:hypothetical protein